LSSIMCALFIIKNALRFPRYLICHIVVVQLALAHF
jgi:hypothetical protein